MSSDPFTGRQIEFGQVIRVGRQRKDGKYPVTTIFKSTGSRFNNIMTKAQLDEQIRKSRTSGNPAEVYGYTPPPDVGHASMKKSAKQLDAEIADILAGPTVGPGSFQPGQRVKCSYRGDHVGKVLAVDDPRAWAKTLAFPQDKPPRLAVKEHVLRHPTVAMKSIPVLYKFGVQWDNRDCLTVV
jgi:hypothetical protein